jgi:hypothetical protein
VSKFVFNAEPLKETKDERIHGLTAIEVKGREISVLMRKHAQNLRKRMKRSEARSEKLLREIGELQKKAVTTLSYSFSASPSGITERLNKAQQEAMSRASKRSEAAKLDFMASHLRAGEVYVLSESDLMRIGIGA